MISIPIWDKQVSYQRQKKYFDYVLIVYVPINFNVLHCLGLIDALSINRHTESFERIKGVIG